VGLVQVWTRTMLGCAAQHRKRFLMSSMARSSDRWLLASFAFPASVAIIGATDRDGSVGRTVVANLRAGSYQGKVYAINPRRSHLASLPRVQEVQRCPPTRCSIRPNPSPAGPCADPTLPRSGARAQTLEIGKLVKTYQLHSFFRPILVTMLDRHRKQEPLR